jgi:peptidyl-tRNA hydrolase, PTH1 family
MTDLRLVAGLGNPGPEYSNTRHNIGFMVLDYLAQRHHCEFSFSASWASAWTKWDQVLLVKPLTYMNRSGDALASIVRYFKIEPSAVLTVVDDLALPLGRLRLRSTGSDGGHNGLKSIISHLGEEFMRLRIGIGASPDSDQTIDYVLSRFTKEEQPVVNASVARAADAVEHIVEKGLNSAMNLFNRTDK